MIPNATRVSKKVSHQKLRDDRIVIQQHARSRNWVSTQLAMVAVVFSSELSLGSSSKLDRSEEGLPFLRFEATARPRDLASPWPKRDIQSRPSVEEVPLRHTCGHLQADPRLRTRAGLQFAAVLRRQPYHHYRARMARHCQFCRSQLGDQEHGAQCRQTKISRMRSVPVGCAASSTFYRSQQG